MSTTEADDPNASLRQEEIETLQAELREAMQHRHAALERMREAQAELSALMARARTLLASREPDEQG